MDTLGAIMAPITALWLLRLTSHDYHQVLAWTLVPGILAALTFGLLVRERPNDRSATGSFWFGVRQLPPSFRRLLLAVGIFGLGDFSHTLLILFATQALTPAHGRAAAASIAVGLYLLHNIFYAAFAYLGGWLSDHVRQRRVILAGGYGLAVAEMAAILVSGPKSLLLLAAVFVLAGMVVGVEEALEDSITGRNSCRRSSTAWVSERSRRSTPSVISPPASLLDCSGVLFRRPLRSAFPVCCSC